MGDNIADSWFATAGVTGFDPASPIGFATRLEAGP
jgi:hypothetical protein